MGDKREAVAYTEDPVELTVEQALSVLPEGERIHTFRSGGFGLFGADWDRPDVEAAVRAARYRQIGGGMCRSMKHGLVIENGERWLFVQAVPERLDALDRPAAPPEQPHPDPSSAPAHTGRPE